MEDKMTKRMTAPVTAAQKKRYGNLARDLGITEADLVRRALAYYFRTERENAQILAEQERKYQSAVALTRSFKRA